VSDQELSAIRERLEKMEQVLYGPSGLNGLAGDSRAAMAALFGSKRSNYIGLVRKDKRTDRLIVLLFLITIARWVVPPDALPVGFRELLTLIVGALM